ncbi:MAG: lysophospholipid acyltransferase family protein [Acidobacteriota bacterium]
MMENRLAEDQDLAGGPAESTTNVVRFSPEPAPAPQAEPEIEAEAARTELRPVEPLPAVRRRPRSAARPKAPRSRPPKPAREARKTRGPAAKKKPAAEGKTVAVTFLDREQQAEPAAGKQEAAAETPAPQPSFLARLLDPDRIKRKYLEFRMRNRSLEVDDFGYDRKFTESIMPLFEFLYEKWWRVDLSGLEHIPLKGRALLVVNHSGVLPWDGIMMRLGIEREHPSHRMARFLALDMFALLPVLAPLLVRGGMVRACQENGEMLLNRDELVGVFPEGVKGVGKYFRDRYRLARFGRGGFIRLAVRTGSPVIPCAVTGAEEIYPVLAKANWIGKPIGLPYFPITPFFPHLGLLGVIPLPTKWYIDFGEPIDFGKDAKEQLDNPIRVNRMAQEVRAVIQRMLNARLQRRKSVWFS